jgi:hypothetical protein
MIEILVDQTRSRIPRSRSRVWMSITLGGFDPSRDLVVDRDSLQSDRNRLKSINQVVVPVRARLDKGAPDR